MENTQPPILWLLAWNIILPLGFWLLGRAGEWMLIKVLDFWASLS
jgi:hypothetical protein